MVTFLTWLKALMDAKGNFVTSKESEAEEEEFLASAGVGEIEATFEQIPAEEVEQIEEDSGDEFDADDIDMDELV